MQLFYSVLLGLGGITLSVLGIFLLCIGVTLMGTAFHPL